ncbi:MAG: hypothetical protein U0229_17105 [Anaeromyxobacter sp.]
MAVLIGSLLAAEPPAADAHVLAGARLFRENRFAEALVEFRVAERQGAAEARGYVAASLVKLGREEEALELFEGGPAPQGGRDALLDYYHALACYGARLYLQADELLARIGPRTGPRIAEQAAKVRADIAAAIPRDPPRDAIEWYLARSDAHAAAGRTALALAHAREARALGQRRADRFGVAEGDARLGRPIPAKAATERRP